jgi:hypothetical protein
VDLDRQAIERRDFPISRRGYDTATVDAHLQALAGEFDELRRAAAGGAESSLASAAGSQVQSIIQAAETAAAEIERQALEAARSLREEAEEDAERTRLDAIETARAHVAAVSQMAATLLERVGSMDGEVGALMESLRAGAGRLSKDLAAVETGMGDLYDAASGRRATGARSGAGDGESTPGEATTAKAPREAPTAKPPATATPAARGAAPQAAGAGRGAPPASPAAPQPAASPPANAEPKHEEPASGDLDGARLIALNMALNGEPRAETERYLAENFRLADREKLIDEVYAAIEG